MLLIFCCSLEPSAAHPRSPAHLSLIPDKQKVGLPHSHSNPLENNIDIPRFRQTSHKCLEEFLWRPKEINVNQSVAAHVHKAGAAASFTSREGPFTLLLLQRAG